MVAPTMEKYRILIEALELTMPDSIDLLDPNLSTEQKNILIQAKEIINENQN